MAFGAYIGGCLPAIGMQNSGFAAATNAIASLLIPCRVPAMLIVSWRGKADDSPEHDVMGDAFPGIVAALGLRMVELPKANIANAINEACTQARRYAAPVILSVEKGIL